MLAKDFDTFVDFRYKTNEDGYFYIGDVFSAGRQKLSGSNTTTEAYGYSGSLVLTITEKAMAEGAEEFDKELAEKEARDAQKAEEEKKNEKAKESSSTESSQSSKSAV